MKKPFKPLQMSKEMPVLDISVNPNGSFRIILAHKVQNIQDYNLKDNLEEVTRYIVAFNFLSYIACNDNTEEVSDIKNNMNQWFNQRG